MNLRSSAVEDDARSLAAELERWFPGTTVWFGSRTLRWWAMVPGVNALIEETHPGDLGRRLYEMYAGRLPVRSGERRRGVSWVQGSQAQQVPVPVPEQAGRDRAGRDRAGRLMGGATAVPGVRR